MVNMEMGCSFDGPCRRTKACVQAVSGCLWRFCADGEGPAVLALLATVQSRLNPPSVTDRNSENAQVSREPGHGESITLDRQSLEQSLWPLNPACVPP